MGGAYTSLFTRKKVLRVTGSKAGDSVARNTIPALVLACRTENLDV